MKIKLRKRIRSCVRKVDKNLVQRMCEHVYRKVDAVRRSGDYFSPESKK